MASQIELDSTYMGVAMLHAKLSKARRSRVGACLVTSQGVCIPGYNGTPSGLDNNCEEITGWNYTEIETGERVPLKVKTTPILTTKPSVIHAERNCLVKAAKEGISCDGSTAYVTLSPCVGCAAMMIGVGILRVVYADIYRDTEGLDLLQQAGIITEQFKE